LKNSIIGKDKNGKILRIGDRCQFLVKKKGHIGLIPSKYISMEGTISYDEEYFAFVFDIEDEYQPCLFMKIAEYKSIERVEE